jgi:hypothetical protein
VGRKKPDLAAEEIIDQLAYPREHRLPRLALEQALARPVEVTPFLLAELSRTHDEIEARGNQAKEGTSYFMFAFALALLGAFREPRAFPLLVRFFSGPAEQVGSIAGYMITEDLGHILVRCYNGDLPLLKSLAETEGAEVFARGAALKAMVVLSMTGVLERESVVAYFAGMLESRRGPEAGFFESLLVECAIDLRAPELRGPIESWFDADLVDESLVSPDDIDWLYSRSDEQLDRAMRGNDHMEDVIGYFEGWPWFEPPAARRLGPASRRPPLPTGGALAEFVRADIAITGRFGPLSHLFNTTTEVRASPKIGRNDPCPCGSGLKHKKCCLDRVAIERD